MMFEDQQASEINSRTGEFRVKQCLHEQVRLHDEPVGSRDQNRTQICVAVQ